MIKESNNPNTKLGYIGLYFDIDLKDILTIFKEEDLHEYGIEEDPHVTVFYGLTGETENSIIKEHIEDMVITNDDISIEGISLFDTNDEYDVVKLDIESEKLREYNKIISQYPNENEFPDYMPHMTLAYVKKGKGEDYLKDEIVDIVKDRIKYADMHYEFGMYGREGGDDNITFSIICE